MTMKTLTPQEELWIERGMTLDRWLDNRFEALVHLGNRSFPQRIRDKSHHGSADVQRGETPRTSDTGVWLFSNR